MMLKNLVTTFIVSIGWLLLLSCDFGGTEIPTSPVEENTGKVAPTMISKDAMCSTSLEQYVQRGKYEVGVRTLYFHDPSRQFDSWNARHASNGYKAVIEEINASGENQIVVAHMWYPVDAGDSTRETTLEDFSYSDSRLVKNAYESGLQFALYGLTSEEGTGAGVSSDQESRSELWDEVKRRLINSLHQAPIADGNFPIVIAAHGLGGNSFGWMTFAEYFASRGYVVVAPNFISDSSLPNVLDSPDSRHAQATGLEAVDRAYRTIFGESKVIPGFYKYFFDSDGSAGFGNAGTQSSLRAVPGGGQRVGEMMGEFFTQRVDDVETIIDGLEILNTGSESCASEYSARGQSKHGAQVCGLFTDSFNLESVGIMGHSLGSMTAQFAVARSDRVAAAVGYNNGPPRYWEPEGIFGEGAARDGQPAGNPKPVMQIHGSEDAFVQSIFRGLMWNTLSAAGGNPEDIWVLEQERVLPTDENPQPIARNAYNRATGDKVIISVKDVDHDSLVNDFPSVISERTPIVVDGTKYWNAIRPSSRKAVGQDVLTGASSGESYIPLGWDTIGDYEAYMPTFIRNYYTKNWFDFYLKEDKEGLCFTENIVEDKGILDIRSDVRSP